VYRLQNEIHFDVVTRNVDYKSTVPYENVAYDQWIGMENGSRTFYISTGNLRWRTIRELMHDTQYDIIYLQSMFSYYFTIVPLVLHRRGTGRVVLEPHGMLAQGAMSGKSFKKTVFINLFKLFGFHKRILFHASSKNEYEHIQQKFGKQIRIKLAPSIPGSIKEMTTRNIEKKVGKAIFFFLARISPEKNLHYAIDRLKEVTGDVEFNIIGPVSDEQYWKGVQKEIMTLPDHIEVNYKGELDRVTLRKTIPGQHFLLLPTLGESFGQSIIESLGFGVPVIISDQTPWVDLREANAGFALPLDRIQEFTNAIQQCIDMDQQKYDGMSKAALEKAQSFVDDDALLQASRDLFESA